MSKEDNKLSDLDTITPPRVSIWRRVMRMVRTWPLLLAGRNYRKMHADNELLRAANSDTTRIAMERNHALRQLKAYESAWSILRRKLGLTETSPNGGHDLIERLDSLLPPTLDSFLDSLRAHGVVHEYAIYDPDGWDGGVELERATALYYSLFPSLNNPAHTPLPASEDYLFSMDPNAVSVESAALFAVALPDTRGRHCYLTTGDGDPPRTYAPKHANRYKTRAAAEAAIVRARKTTPLRERTMIVVPHPANTGVSHGAKRCCDH